MQSNFPGSPNRTGASPYVAQIPRRFHKGDSATWRDVAFVDASGVGYTSADYTLRYTLAGPIPKALVLTAVPEGSGWRTALTTAASGALSAGLFWWTAQLVATGVQITIATGELVVDHDLATAGANYDQRTQAEKALMDAEAALATFQSSGGRVQAYTIGNRHMTFQTDRDILAIVTYWRARVVSEKSAASNRIILTRFNRAH